MRRTLLAAALVLGCWVPFAAPGHAQQVSDPLAELAAVGVPLVAPTAGGSGESAAAAPAPDRSPPARPSAADPAPAAGAPGSAPETQVPNPLDLFGVLDPGAWARAILDTVVETFAGALLEAIRGFVDWALGIGDSSLNFVTRTPAEGTYESATVRALWDFTRALASAGLALLVLWGGFNVIVKEHLRAPYDGVMELLPRVVLAAVAINLTLEFARVLIDLNNAFAAAVGEVSLPGYEQADASQSGMAMLLLAVTYGVVSLLLALQMLMRLALIDVLIILAPLMVLLWVIPQTQGWTRWWAHLLPLTVFQQAVQVLALRLGAALMVELTPGSVENALLTLLLGIAVCWLTLKVPSLLRGQVHHAGLSSVVSLVVLSRAGGALASRAGAASGAAAAGAR